MFIISGLVVKLDQSTLKFLKDLSNAQDAGYSCPEFVIYLNLKTFF